MALAMNSVFTRSGCKIAVSADNSMSRDLVKACKWSGKVRPDVEIWTESLQAGIVRVLDRWWRFALGMHHVETPVDYHADFHRSGDAWSGAHGVGCQFGVRAGGISSRGGTGHMHG